MTKRGRGRGAGRGRGRAKKVPGSRNKKAVVSDEESMDQSMDGMDEGDVSASSTVGINMPMDASSDDAVAHELNKENDGNENDEKSDGLNEANIVKQQPVPATEEQQLQAQHVLPQTIDMEADISQLEAPTFTTISRGPPEPMLRLKWDHKVNLIGEKVLNPMIHCCDQCLKPILLYGRMIPCKHVFCLKCARAEPVKSCPRCNDKVIRVEQSGLGTVFMCTHGGSRYGNTGCRRTYLSQRDLQAHINHRHITQMPMPPVPVAAAAEIKQNLDMPTASSQRKLSESNVSGAPAAAIQTPSSLLAQQRQTNLRATAVAGAGLGSIATSTGTSSSSNSAASYSHSTLTQANIARINAANVQECHQSKAALHQTLKKTPMTQSIHQTPETVADASYYSSVLNAFCSNSGGQAGSS